MKNKVSVKQNGFKDCASACLLSIIRHYGGNYSKEEISYLIKTDTHGTNAYNLIEGAKKLGMDGYGIKQSFNELISNKVILPLIAHTKNSNMYHYIVVYEIGTKTIKIMDPAYGIKKISYKEFKEMYLGVIIVLYPVRKLEQLKTKDKIIKEVIRHVFSNKKSVIKIIVLSILVTILSIINSMYLKVFIDYIYINFTLKFLLIITGSFLLLIFLKNIFDCIRLKILSNIKEIVGSSITNDAITHIMNLPYYYFKSKPSGEIISRIDDLDNFKELISTIILNIFVDILLMAFSIMVLILINKTLFIVSLIIIALYSLVVFIYSLSFKNKIYDIQKIEGEYKKELVELIESYETIKNLNLINNFVHKTKVKFNSLIFKLKNFEYSYSNQMMFKNIISDAGLLIIATVGLILVNSKLITIGDLVAFSSLVLFFTEPIKELLNLEPSIRYASGAYERINDLMMINTNNINNMDKSKIEGSIILKDLGFSYNNVDYIFESVNMSFKNGGKYLICGSSGSGKSTLAKIILKYYEDYKGEIIINDKNLKDINASIIRNSITYISQKEVLLSDTIKNNIILARDIKEREYREIIKLCKIDKIIDSKKLRDNFLLEDNGFNLSGGERQKLILARGLLKESNIIILDEALSEVGLLEEKEIMEGILKKYDKKMIICITHKDNLNDLFKYKYTFLKKGGTYVN